MLNRFMNQESDEPSHEKETQDPPDFLFWKRLCMYHIDVIWVTAWRWILKIVNLSWLKISADGKESASATPTLPWTVINFLCTLTCCRSRADVSTRVAAGGACRVDDVVAAEGCGAPAAPRGRLLRMQQICTRGRARGAVPRAPRRALPPLRRSAARHQPAALLRRRGKLHETQINIDLENKKIAIYFIYFNSCVPKNISCISVATIAYIIIYTVFLDVSLV